MRTRTVAATSLPIEAPPPREAHASHGEARSESNLARAWLAGSSLTPQLARALEDDATPAERRAAAAALAEAAIDLPHNRALRVVLRDLRVAGRIEPEHAKEIVARAGRLSTTEQQAIGETLLAAELAHGLDPLAAKALRAHLADELLARSSEIRTARITTGAFTALSAASGGVAAAAAPVFAALAFSTEPLPTLLITLTMLFGIGSTVGCAKIAVNRAVDSTTYGVDD